MREGVSPRKLSISPSGGREDIHWKLRQEPGGVLLVLKPPSIPPCQGGRYLQSILPEWWSPSTESSLAETSTPVKGRPGGVLLFNGYSLVSIFLIKGVKKIGGLDVPLNDIGEGENFMYFNKIIS